MAPIITLLTNDFSHLVENNTKNNAKRSAESSADRQRIAHYSFLKNRTVSYRFPEWRKSFC
jgi:hypothetical protein